VTIDKSLKRKGRLARTRNVLQRHERIAKMKEDDKWLDGKSPFGLPKLRIVKLVIGKKKKKAVNSSASGLGAAPNQPDAVETERRIVSTVGLLLRRPMGIPPDLAPVADRHGGRVCRSRVRRLRRGFCSPRRVM
jgi:small basic protein (TIGR04137 family)